MISVSTIGSIADSSFNPKYISNMQLWFDAADSSTLYNNPTGSILTIPSGTVGRWEDKSPNAWHATQSVVANQPIRITGSQFNGLDTLRFDGTNDMMYLANALGIMKAKTEATFFLVGTSENKATNSDWFFISINGNSAGARIAFRTNATSGITRAVYRRLDAEAAFTPPHGGTSTSGSILGYYTAAVKFDGSSSYYYTNGSQQLMSGSNPVSWSGSVSNTDSAAVSVGSNAAANANFLLGNLGEFIYYDRYLSDTERRTVERYLSRKWNVRSYDQKTSSSLDLFSNLEMYVDANNAASYPGTGTVWYDLSGKNRTGSLLNGVTYDTTDGIKSFSFDGTNDSIDFGKVFLYSSESFSMSCWAQTISGSAISGIHVYMGRYNYAGYFSYAAYSNSDKDLGRVVTSFYQTPSPPSYPQTDAITNNNSVYHDNWSFVTITRSGALVNTYVNGVYAQGTRTSMSDPGTNANSNFSVGTVDNGSYFSKMKVGMVIVHSKVLTSQEVLELYNFTKGTYKKID